MMIRKNGKLSGIEVDAPGAAIILGDSITDGYGSTLDANRRWPDVPADQLVAAHVKLGVVDAGISGNRLLHDQPVIVGGDQSRCANLTHSST